MTKGFYNQDMKKSLCALIIVISILLLPVSALAVRIRIYNGTITAKSGTTLTIEVDRGTLGKSTYTATPTSGTFNISDAVTFSVDEDNTPPTIVLSTLSKGINSTAAAGVGSTSTPSTYRLFPALSCPEDTALTCYTNQVFAFSQIAVLLLSVAAFVIAGIIYMTSAGNPKQVEMSKKIMLGALSAIAVIVLGRFFLINVVGVPLT